MAPKRSKSGAAIVEEPRAKRVETFLKQQGVSRANFGGVKEILDHPLADLSDDCRNMLRAMLPWSLCIPADLRRGFQQDVVKMLEQVASTIQAQLSAGVEAQNAALADQDSQQKEFQQGVEDTASAVAAATAAGATAAEALDRASTVVEERKSAFSEVAAKEIQENARFNRASVRKQAMEQVLAGPFKKLKDGQWQSGEEEDLFKPVKAIVPHLEMDGSLSTSLAISILKTLSERGPFDKKVIQTFEETLRLTISKVASDAEALHGDAAIHIAALNTAREGFEAAQKEHKEALAKVDAAQESVKKATGAGEEAKHVAETFQATYDQATAARKEKREELDSFKDYNLALFGMLVEKKATPETKEEIKEEKPDEEVGPASEADEA